MAKKKDYNKLPQVLNDIRKQIYVGKDDREISMCTSKRYFRLEENAVRELKAGKRKGYIKEDGYLYRCDYCDGWHITNGHHK
jgi:hypothetical protein